MRRAYCEKDAMRITKFMMNTQYATHDTHHKIKAVVFDLGETILNFGKVNTVSLFREGAKLSYEYLKSCGQSVGNYEIYCWRNLISLRIKNLISNITGNDFDSSAFLRKIGTKKGMQLNSEQWKHFAWLWYEPLSKIAKIEPDIKQTLSSLKNAGLKLGILSNTFVSAKSIEKQLEEIGILEFFSMRMYSYQFTFRKPDLRIFKIAAERIGEAFENIIYVGDRVDKDAKPTLKLGMTPVLKTAYTNTGKAVPQGVFQIHNLSELPKLIEKINK
ncbi:MAG: HAD family hydrolase [Sedimentisphaerales bacterium]|nr:HAD family hydrolase [Sedimentisphaerales bacterium]